VAACACAGWWRGIGEQKSQRIFGGGGLQLLFEGFYRQARFQSFAGD
jgi:hypothetical protein